MRCAVAFLLICAMVRASRSTIHSGDPLACALQTKTDMRRTKIDKHGAPKGTPYDDLRRARHGELRLKDQVGLSLLMDDYFAYADELEVLPRPPRAA